MKPAKIFIDLDDVLADFTMPALAEAGCPVEPDDLDEYPIECGFDIVKAANTLCGDENFAEPLEFWKCLKREFWANLQISKEATWLLSTCEALVGSNSVCIITAPVFPEDEVVSAKAEWIGSFMPEWLHDQYLIGKTKHFCAGPEALLIDDSDRNVQEFGEAGGRVILWPRPWNSLNAIAHCPQTYVMKRLDFFFGPLC